MSLSLTNVMEAPKKFTTNGRALTDLKFAQPMEQFVYNQSKLGLKKGSSKH